MPSQAADRAEQTSSWRWSLCGRAEAATTMRQAEAHRHSRPSRRRRSMGWWALPPTAAGAGLPRVWNSPATGTKTATAPACRSRHLTAAEHSRLELVLTTTTCACARMADGITSSPNAPTPSSTTPSTIFQLSTHLRQDGRPNLVSQRGHGRGRGAQEADARGRLIQRLGQLRLLARVAPAGWVHDSPCARLEQLLETCRHVLLCTAHCEQCDAQLGRILQVFLLLAPCCLLHAPPPCSPAGPHGVHAGTHGGRHNQLHIGIVVGVLAAGHLEREEGRGEGGGRGRGEREGEKGSGGLTNRCLERAR